MAGISGKCAIVGAAETDGLGHLPDHTTLRLHTEAAVNAIRDAGLTIDAIDGIASTGRFAVDVAHDLGIVPQWVDTTSVGGCSYMLHVRHACAAIAAGQATTVLIVHGESGRSRNAHAPFRTDSFTPRGQFEQLYGVGPFYSMFTVPALRFMKEFGVSHEQLATVVTVQREWSSRNPRALRRELLTVSDVLNSPLVAYPFHKPECCVVTDGGGALVVTSSDRVSASPTTPVYVLGTGESAEHPIVSQMADFTSSRAFRVASAAAFREAGLRPADIDHLMIYDAFAHVPLYALQDLGFVGRGEAAGFIEDRNTAPGGRLPMNTNGGGLSYTHTGMYGMFAILEGVRQLRGEAAAQVPGVTTSFVQGVGGMFMAAGSLILSNAL